MIEQWKFVATRSPSLRNCRSSYDRICAVFCVFVDIDFCKWTEFSHCSCARAQMQTSCDFEGDIQLFRQRLSKKSVKAHAIFGQPLSKQLYISSKLPNFCSSRIHIKHFNTTTQRLSLENIFPILQHRSSVQRCLQNV